MNIARILERSRRLFPDKPALIFEGASFTYRDLDEMSSRVANGLSGLGVSRGDRVALFLPNIPAFVSAYFGIQKIGALAEALGIEHYFAEVLPEGKAHIVEQLQADDASVCFVGDGINDAIALKKAHVSVSLRGASTIAADAASIVLLDGNLEKMGRLFEIADGLNINLRRDFLASFVPGAVAIGGVFLFHVGVLPAFVIGMGGFAVGMANAMLPRLTAGNAET